MKFKLALAGLMLAFATQAAFAQDVGPTLQFTEMPAVFQQPAGFQPSRSFAQPYGLTSPRSFVQQASYETGEFESTEVCDDCGCPSCGCYPCQCAQQPAPCVPCPRLSTVSPYWNVGVFGIVQANMLFNTARPLAPGTPFFLLPNSVFPENTVDIHARSSFFGAAFSGPEVGGMKAGGLFLFCLYNDAIIVDRYGFLPLQAYGELKNDEWRVSAGLQFNVFAPQLPTMLTFSSMLGSGNVGNNFPGQFRIERYIPTSSDSRWTIQLALSEPVASSINDMFILDEDNGWPTLEGRIGYSIGDPTPMGITVRRPFDAGISFVGGQNRTFVPFNGDTVANIWGVSADMHWRINERFGILGEAWVGQGLGTLNGTVLQTANSFTFLGIRGTGYWGEAYYYLNPCLHTHVGGGVDDPFDRDLDLFQIQSNRTVFANLLWDITPQVRLGFEVTYRKTNWDALPNNQGYGFHTQMQFAF